MAATLVLAVLWAASCCRCLALAAQIPLGQPAPVPVPGSDPGSGLEPLATVAAEETASASDVAPARKLKGRFLHITDIHIDPHYRPGAKASKSCHRGKGPGGLLGYPGTRCDSPPLLVDATFDWIRTNLLDEVDFIVWTGDAARHDNDPKIPRSVQQVLNATALVVDHVLDFFTDTRSGSSTDDDAHKIY
ncbi:Endopolyphosphatase [Ascosphaera acerosa]|nr:Endopolyphosphatase [Ascosphaera acerosa]